MTIEPGFWKAYYTAIWPKIVFIGIPLMLLSFLLLVFLDVNNSSVYVALFYFYESGWFAQDYVKNIFQLLLEAMPIVLPLFWVIILSSAWFFKRQSLSQAKHHWLSVWTVLLLAITVFLDVVSWFVYAINYGFGGFMFFESYFLELCLLLFVIVLQFFLTLVVYPWLVIKTAKQ